MDERLIPIKAEIKSLQQQIVEGCASFPAEFSYEAWYKLAWLGDKLNKQLEAELDIERYGF